MEDIYGGYMEDICPPQISATHNVRDSSMDMSSTEIVMHVGDHLCVYKGTLIFALLTGL